MTTQNVTAQDTTGPKTTPNTILRPGPGALTTAQTLLRVVTGFLFAAHGWQKYNEFTLAGTEAAFGQMGVPAANLAAPFVATLELAGGIALILGLLARPVGAVLAAVMLGAIALVHAPAGVFVEAGGFELVLALGAGAATVALLGAGRWSLDTVLFGRRGALSKLA
ncbi:DoxX family protein [Zafaria sp. Z1313]|uniref:DoxX family protein n=1 Tax=unclassified Zafaria TaxID=2828765 RepID=UPI002E7A8708|nr:DoxX family protein [Zafaria sp. J156]MEE1619789.1 DoxX family protein [Zafaria sp. J156]